MTFLFTSMSSIAGVINQPLSQGSNIEILLPLRIIEITIYLYCALQQLSLWKRRRGALTHLLFAISCLSLAGYSGGILWMERAIIIKDFLVSCQFQVLFLCSFFIFFTWFISEYAAFKPKYFLWILASIYFVLAIVNFLTPTSMFYSEVRSLSWHLSPWGESLVVPDADYNPWFYLYSILTWTIYLFCLWASLRYYRHGEKEKGIFLGLAILFIISGSILDTFVEFGLINFPYIGELGFLGFVLLMNSNLSTLLWCKIEDANEELKKANNELAFLTSIIDSTSDLVSISTTDNQIKYMNNAGKQLLGWTEEDSLANKKITEAHPAWAYSKIKNEVIPKVIHDGIWSGETAISNKNGREVPVSQVMMAHKSSSGELLYYSTIIRDITEQKETQKALHESEKKHRRLIENLQGSFLYQHGANGVFTYVSPSVTKLLGYSIEEFKTHYTEYLTDNPQNKQVKEYTEQCLNGIKQPGYELEIYHKDGSIRWLDINELPIYDESGSVVAVEGIAHDITERKNLTAQLRQAEKMQALGQLAGGIAHDFNNQLAGIIGFADLLEESIEDEKLKEYANNILICANREIKLIRQLLDFSRKGEYKCVPVKMHKIINEVGTMLESSINKNISIRSEFNAESDYVYGDPIMIQNALLNLSVNARDAMPQGGTLIFKTSSKKLDMNYCANSSFDISPGPYLQVKISDTGKGIASYNLEHIFEPFFTTKEQGKGTGLGLAAVYGMVEQHNGAIFVESEYHEGTTFKILLPLMEKVEEVSVNVTKKEVVAHSNYNILLVEDELNVRKVSIIILERLGYRITSFENGQLALEYYKENWKKIDLVILDLIMPVLGGVDTFKVMKKINPDIKTLICSGFSDGAVKDLIKNGATDYILKPYSKSELSIKVASIFHKEQIKDYS